MLAAGLLAQSGMAIPRDPALDSTLAVLRDGYTFIWDRCRQFNSDLFLTRVLGQRAVCIHGREAASLFYDEDRFERHPALPRRVVTSLFGKGAVHTLDDSAHHHRKAAFLSLMTPANLARLMDGTARQWRFAIRAWERADAVVLFDEVQQVLAAAVCEWAGVPLAPDEIPARARDLMLMVDAFGGVGPRLWKGKLARHRAERWIADLIEDVRRGGVHAEPDTALHVMAQHRELDGSLLDARTAAVEVLNVLRPTVAVAWYIAFAALALHEHPAAQAALAREPFDGSAGEATDLFMQEVRRYYPFTPFLGATVRRPFDWRGHRFTPGTLVLLDVYGTNHDPALWDEPDAFRPERFRHWRNDAFGFIPQGGGDRATGHRCPGEWVTMHNITLALHVLTRCATYEVAPDQDLRIDLTRMPTRPRSGFVLRQVRATPLLDDAFPRQPSPTAARDSAAALASGEAQRALRA